jgi:hypothetical protein
MALSIPSLDGDLINVEVVALPFFLGALLAALDSRRRSAAVAGGLFGLALITRPSFALDGLALLVPLLTQVESRVWRLSGAVSAMLAVLSAAALLLWAQGSWTAFIQTTVPSDHAYFVWTNRENLFSIVLRLAALAALSGIGLWKSRSPGARLLAVWLPASVAGGTLTPREFLHYAQEAVPPLALTAALLASKVRPRWAAAPTALAGLLVAVQLVTALPARERGLLTSTSTPPIRFNFGFTELPAYYGNWAGYVLGRESWSQYAGRFPSPVGREREEAAALRALTRSSPEPTLLVLGDDPWLYVESDLTPAGPYVDIGSTFPMVRGVQTETVRLLKNDCPTVVVIAPDAPGWSGPALRQGGYHEVSKAPWPTFVAPDQPDCDA